LKKKTIKTQNITRRVSDPDPDPHTNYGSGSGSRREKITPKNGKRTEFSSFEVLDVHF
jgi:hypothetical protein